GSDQIQAGRTIHERNSGKRDSLFIIAFYARIVPSRRWPRMLRRAGVVVGKPHWRIFQRRPIWNRLGQKKRRTC
ncbi:MAG: hypothetical protein AB7F09_22995, partial [Parvibaculaceae bacterium]